MYAVHFQIKSAFQRKCLDIFLMKVPRNSQILKRGSCKMCFQKQGSIKKAKCFFFFTPSSPEFFSIQKKCREVDDDIQCNYQFFSSNLLTFCITFEISIIKILHSVLLFCLLLLRFYCYIIDRGKILKHSFEIFLLFISCCSKGSFTIPLHHKWECFSCI